MQVIDRQDRSYISDRGLELSPHSYLREYKKCLEPRHLLRWYFPVLGYAWLYRKSASYEIRTADQNS